MNITKIATAMQSLVNWTRSGIDKHSTRLVALEQKHRIMQVVLTPEEFEVTKNAAPTQKTIFDSWYRYSHAGGALSTTFPANPSETQAWNYDVETGRINNTTNSNTHIGMVSRTKYDKYVLDVDIWSNVNDDDTIGLLLAWNIDSNGIEHTLVARRTPGGNSPLWAIHNDYMRGTPVGEKIIASNNASVKWGNGGDGVLTAVEAGFVSNAPEVGWNGQIVKHGGRGHIRIRVVRNGDIITAQTSDWADPTVLIPSSLLTVDLAADNALHKFRGPSEYGIMAMSQQNSFWQINEFSNPVDAIYRLDTKEAYRNQGGVWAVDPAIKFDNLENDLWMFNPATGKTFFRKDKNNLFVFDSKVVM